MVDFIVSNWAKGSFESIISILWLFADLLNAFDISTTLNHHKMEAHVVILCLINA